MAALVLSVAGGAAGGAVFGPAGAVAGRVAGALAGRLIDQSLFATNTEIHRERNAQGPRLADLSVMASTQGAPIPRLYGRARLSGQVIWATNLEEVVTTTANTTTTTTETTSGGGGGGGKGFGGGGGGGGTTTTTTTTYTTTYSYFANLAVGLCEGPIGEVSRVWADGKPLDISSLNVRIYTGDESQTADALIVAKEGDAPAYRGLAYVVFERLPVADFGNRIPQLSFEISRPVGHLEKMARAVTLIPGTTEFGYEPGTVVRQFGPGQSAPENRHVNYAPSDVVASLDALQAATPGVENVSVVVAWFGTDLRCGQCRVKPSIDNRDKSTFGGTWSVAGVSRGSARLVSTYDGRPAFGGTPSDDSVRHLIAELKARNLKVTLYPFLVMDIAGGNGLSDPWTGAPSQPAYPWRGRITCDPAPGQAGSPDGTAAAATQVDAFFSGGSDGWNYNNMVLYYAHLAADAGGVDGFLIGSELKSLTRVRSAPGVYPAVDALVSLAASVKAIVGSGTKVTYGADWTEYGAHVVDAGANEVRFPLDALWASSSLDAIGIDYYAPLADWRDDANALDLALSDSIYSTDYLAGNLARGEAYDWYYADSSARDGQTRTPITDSLGKPWIFRQKDIWNFWSQAHYERVGGAELASPTAWTPESKPVWLTEIGCPAVDKGANQPSVFPDAKSSEAGLPYFSDGTRDDAIQRRMLEAVLGAIDPAFGDGTLNPVSSVTGDRMLPPERIYLWSWDARPFPVFPAATDVWSDGPDWDTGHWLTGRLGGAPLDALVGTLLDDCGVTDFDSSELTDVVDGYVVDRPMAPRAMIDPLAQAFAFEAAEQEGTLRFRQRGGTPLIELVEDDLVLPDSTPPALFTRGQESDLPRQVSIGYTDLDADYLRAAAASRRLVGHSMRNTHVDLAVVSNGAEIVRRAEIWLQDLWAGRDSAEFALPPSRLALVPGDVIAVTVNGRRRLIELEQISDTESRAIKARSVDPEVFSLPLASPARRAPAMPVSVGPVHAVVLDLPTLTSAMPPVLARMAAFADPWPGAETIWNSVDGMSFNRLGVMVAPAVVGETLDDLPAGPTARWHDASFGVQLYGGTLTSVTELAVLAGANAAAVQRADGAWEVIQFANAELTAERTYTLSRLLRGQAGSEWAMGAPLAAGAPFVLLDAKVAAVARGLDVLGRTLQLRVVAVGRDTADATALALDVTPQATALMPLSPVHLKARRGADGVTITWIRRTRIDGDTWVGEVPLGEDSEQYALDILSGGDVVRTINPTSPSALYAAADELADFGSAQTSLTLRVAQVSATVGRGFATTATLIP